MPPSRESYPGDNKKPEQDAALRRGLRLETLKKLSALLAATKAHDFALAGSDSLTGMYTKFGVPFSFTAPDGQQDVLTCDQVTTVPRPGNLYYGVTEMVVLFPTSDVFKDYAEDNPEEFTYNFLIIKLCYKGGAEELLALGVDALCEFDTEEHLPLGFDAETLRPIIELRDTDNIDFTEDLEAILAVRELSERLRAQPQLDNDGVST